MDRPPIKDSKPSEDAEADEVLEGEWGEQTNIYDLLPPDEGSADGGQAGQ